MSIDSLPTGIQEFIDATNAADTTRFVGAFTEDAHLNDWGREFSGRDGIASWNRTDNIGVNAHFELDRYAQISTDTYRVVLTVTGGGYNGTGPMVFRLRDGKIASLRIS